MHSQLFLSFTKASAFDALWWCDCRPNIAADLPRAFRVRHASGGRWAHLYASDVTNSHAMPQRYGTGLIQRRIVWAECADRATAGLGLCICNANPSLDATSYIHTALRRCRKAGAPDTTKQRSDPSTRRTARGTRECSRRPGQTLIVFPWTFWGPCLRNFEVRGFSVPPLLPPPVCPPFP